MSVSEQVRPLLAARAATDPNAARLLEMFDKANELSPTLSIQIWRRRDLRNRKVLMWVKAEEYEEIC